MYLQLHLHVCWRWQLNIHCSSWIWVSSFYWLLSPHWHSQWSQNQIQSAVHSRFWLHCNCIQAPYSHTHLPSNRNCFFKSAATRAEILGFCQLPATSCGLSASMPNLASCFAMHRNAHTSLMSLILSATPALVLRLSLYDYAETVGYARSIWHVQGCSSSKQPPQHLPGKAIVLSIWATPVDFVALCLTYKIRLFVTVYYIGL